MTSEGGWNRREAEERVKKEIRELIEKDKRERDGREARGERMGDISEADVRANYIDPLFEILGWDNP